MRALLIPQPSLSPSRGRMSAGVFRSRPSICASKRGSGAPYGAYVFICALTESAPVLRRPVSPYGAPLRRLKSLEPRLPLPGGLRRFRDRGPGKTQGTSPKRHNAPGGWSKDSRDHGCEPWARAPLPAHVSFRLQTFLRRAGTEQLADCETVSKIKFNNDDIWRSAAQRERSHGSMRSVNDRTAQCLAVVSRS